MDALQNLFNRRSVRDFTAQPIEEEKLHRILEAGMSGPCCVNARDWSFIVVTDREKLLEMAEANGRPAQPLKKAAAAILICGDLERAFSPAKDYWVIDGAIAAAIVRGDPKVATAARQAAAVLLQASPQLVSMWPGSAVAVQVASASCATGFGVQTTRPPAVAASAGAGVAVMA